MKIKLYRGPFNGKSMNVALQNSDYIVLARQRPALWNTTFQTTNYASMALTYNQYRYRRTRHTHPDGSVFFEWDRPKGTTY